MPPHARRTPVPPAAAQYQKHLLTTKHATTYGAWRKITEKPWENHGNKHTPGNKNVETKWHQDMEQDGDPTKERVTLFPSMRDT